jgi:hypothetical protein
MFSEKLQDFLKHVHENHETIFNEHDKEDVVGSHARRPSGGSTKKGVIVIKPEGSSPSKLHKKLKLENKLIDLLDNKPYIKIEPSLGGDNTERDDLETKIYYHLKLLTYTDPLSITKNIIYIITELMKFANNFNKPGDEKKHNIITALKRFLIEQEFDEKEITYIIDVICPELIDILVSIDKRKIVIKRKFFGCFPIC